MRLVRLLPDRWHKLAGEVAKFGIVGLVNTAVDFAVFNLFLPIGPLKANVFSTVAATTTSYGLNRHWTYKDRARAGVRREYVLFFVFNLIGLGIQLAVLGIAKYGIGFTEQDDRAALNVAKAVGIAVGTVFRFITYRTFVFRSEPEPAGVPAAAGAAASLGVTTVTDPAWDAAPTEATSSRG